MKHFKLDPRLAADCIVLDRLNESHLLLMNNALLPWFILVPETKMTELTELSREAQASLLEEINLVGNFVKQYFPVSKLNIAAIGNIVSQLHVHVIGRSPDDFCWPGVVWGRTEREPYDEERILEIREAFRRLRADL